MDFVDEQDRAFLGVGEVGQQVLRRGERRAAGDLQRDAQIARDAGGERRLAQAGRAVEQDVAQRLFAFAGGVDGDRQPLGHLALADHLVHVPRPQRDLIVAQLGQALRATAGRRRPASRRLSAERIGSRGMAGEAVDGWLGHCSRRRHHVNATEARYG